MSGAPAFVSTVDAIDARVERREWSFARDRRDEIARHWRTLVADKPAMFDGRVLLMSHADIDEGARGKTMRSAHFETDFSAFIAWRDFGWPDPTVRNCFAMGALLGDDGGFVLAEMGAHTANPGRVYFPAGTRRRYYHDTGEDALIMWRATETHSAAGATG